MTRWPDILVCRCVHAGIVPEDRSKAIADALGEAGLPHVTVPDLCSLCARRDPNLLEWTRRPGRKVVACHPRAIVNLFDAAGAPLPGDTQIVNLRTGSVADAAGRLGIPRTEDGTANTEHRTSNAEHRTQGAGHAAAESTANSRPPSLTPHSPPIAHPSSLPSWLPWFPVIDRARCTSCRQCLEFCLFGVYAFENGRIEVRQPRNCKPNCPACARICPHAAIIFPKHGEAPIDGAPIADDEAERARARHDLHELLGDDIDAALAERRRRAKSRLLDAEKVRRALEERARCSGGGAGGGP